MVPNHLQVRLAPLHEIYTFQSPALSPDLSGGFPLFLSFPSPFLFLLCIGLLSTLHRTICSFLPFQADLDPNQISILHLGNRGLVPLLPSLHVVWSARVPRWWSRLLRPWSGSPGVWLPANFHPAGFDGAQRTVQPACRPLDLTGLSSRGPGQWRSRTSPSLLRWYCPAGVSKSPGSSSRS